MPSPKEIAAEKERLYESSALRDDLNDAEATVLLEWGQGQIDRLAQEFPDEFEQKARFLRQLIKGINRFVGQREFNEMAGQASYMTKVSMYLEALGWKGIDSSHLFAILPDDKADMAGNLSAILGVLSPASATSTETVSDAPYGTGAIGDAAATMSNITENDIQELENPNDHSITQDQDSHFLGKHRDYGEEQEEQ